MSLLGLLAICLVILKATGALAIEWWVALSPILLEFIISCAILIMASKIK